MQVECLPWADETFSRIIGAQMLLTRQPLGWQTRGRMDIDEEMLSANARQCRVNLTRAARAFATGRRAGSNRSEEHTSELQSLMRTSYAVFCLKQTIKATDH